MKYENYAKGYGTFEIDFYDPIEQGIIERNIKFDNAVEIVERGEEERVS